MEIPIEVLVALIAAANAVFLALVGVSSRFALAHLKAIKDSVHAPDQSQPPRTNGNRALIDYAIEASSGIAHLQEQHEQLRVLVVEDIEWRKQHVGGPFEDGLSARQYQATVQKALDRIERKIDDHVQWEMSAKYPEPQHGVRDQDARQERDHRQGAASKKR